MGLMDRDYMRRESPTRAGGGPGWDSLPKTLVLAGTAIAVLSAGVWLFRDLRSIADDLGPAKGSLRVNINTATQDELESVPGVGPARASQIVAGRPWGSIEELDKLNGIGPRQVDDLRPFVKVYGTTEKL